MEALFGLILFVFCISVGIKVLIKIIEYVIFIINSIVKRIGLERQEQKRLKQERQEQERQEQERQEQERKKKEQLMKIKCSISEEELPNKSTGLLFTKTRSYYCENPIKYYITAKKPVIYCLNLIEIKIMMFC